MQPANTPTPAAPPGPAPLNDPFAGATLPALEPYITLSVLFLLVNYLFKKTMDISFGGK